MGWFSDDTPITAKVVAEKFSESYGHYSASAIYFLVSEDRMMAQVERSEYALVKIGDGFTAKWKAPWS